MTKKHEHDPNPTTPDARTKTRPRRGGPARLSVTEPVPSGAVFDHRQMAYVFTQRGLTINAVASRLDLSYRTLEELLRGAGDPGEIRVATLMRLAEVLGIPLRSLFAAPPPLSDTAPTPVSESPDQSVSDLAADVEQLIATTYDRGRGKPTFISELAAAFGWTHDRVYATAREADRRLRYAGLKVHTTHGQLFIAPVNDHLDALQALSSQRAHDTGFKMNQYRYVYSQLGNDPKPIPHARSKRLDAVGALINHGILTTDKSPTLTAAAREAFLCD